MFAPLLLALFAGNTWYVDVNAVPPGNGTQGSPYTSIQYALAAVATADGDTVIVAPGNYVEQVVFTKRVRVSASGGPLATQLSVPGGGNVVESRISSGGPGPILHPMVSGFTIRGSQFASSGVYLIVESAKLALDHCIVTGFATSPAVFQHGNNFLQLYQCTVAGNGAGIHGYASYVGGTFSYGCIVRENGVDVVGPIMGYYGFHACCIPASLVGQGSANFSASPGLWDWQGGDFHLKPLSPCIDTGNHWSLPPDPDGSPADVGALAYSLFYAPHPNSYCTPKTNSLGCAVSISSTGSASLSGPDDFMLGANFVLNNKPGLFLWSGKPKATPFAGATLCLKPPIVRGTPLTSGGSPSGNDCTGVFQWHFSQAYMASKGMRAGSILYAQAWGRDPGFAPPNNAQLSDARVFPVGP